MNYKLILILAVLGIFLGACKSKENMAEVTTAAEETTMESNPYVDNETKFTEVELTQRTSFGGVRSNLAGVRHYQLTLTISEMKDGIEFKNLMVDSISIPFSNLFIDGDKQSSFIVDKNEGTLKVNTYRNLYSKDPDAPQMVEEIEYAKSGLDLEGKAVVEYYRNGKPYYLEIPEIKKLENIYTP